MSPIAERRPAFPAWPLALALGLLFAGQVWAFHWGVITPDTEFQWGQALAGRYDDWHPPATAWLWRQLMPLGPGTAPVLLFDGLLYWGGFALIADALRQRGQTLAMAAAVLVAATPIPFGQMGAILKDPLLAACCLLATGLILAGGRASRIAAVLLLVFASAVRMNAVFATAPLLVALLPPRWTNRPLRLPLALLAALALLACGSVLIDSVWLRPHRAQPIFSLVNFDLGGIVAQGDATAYPNLDPATARRVTAECYDPRQYNPKFADACNRVEDALFDHVTARHLSPTGVWLHAIAAAPGAWLRHRLSHFNQNIRLYVGRVPDDAVYVMSQPNPYGLRFAINDGTRLVLRGARTMAWSPLGRPATWLAVALGLLIVGWRLPSRRFVLGLAASALGYGGAYAIVSVAPDLRYNLWTMLAAALALVMAAADMRRDPACRPDRRTVLLAATPTAVAIIVELGGMALA